MSFYYKDVVWGNFLPFPFYGQKHWRKFLQGSFQESYFSELLGWFYLMDAVNPVTELGGGRNIKGKPHIDVSHWFLTFHLRLKTLSFRTFWNVHLLLTIFIPGFILPLSLFSLHLSFFIFLSYSTICYWTVAQLCQMLCFKATRVLIEKNKHIDAQVYAYIRRVPLLTTLFLLTNLSHSLSHLSHYRVISVGLAPVWVFKQFQVDGRGITSTMWLLLGN